MISFRHLLLILSIAAIAFLGLVTILQGERRKIKFAYSIYMVSALCWMGAVYFFRTATDIDTLVISSYVLYVAPLFIPTSLFYFCTEFPFSSTISSIKKQLIVGVPFLIIFIILCGTRGIVATVELGTTNLVTYGSLYFLYVLYHIGLTNFALWHLLQKSKVANEREKPQLKAV